MYSVFGKSTLYTVESEYCGREVAAVESAAKCSAVSQLLLQFVLQKLMERKVTSSSQRFSISTLNFDDDNGELSPIRSMPSKEVKQEIQTVLIRHLLVLLKATCLSWQCAGLVLSGSRGLDADAGLTAIGVSLNSLLDIVQSSIERQQIEPTQSLATVFDEKISTEIENVISQAEKLLEQSFETLGLCALPPLPSILSGRKGSISPKELSISPVSTAGGLSDCENSLRRFYVSCQSSYLTIGSDLLAAYVHSRTPSSAPFGAPLASPLSSPLTGSTRASADDDSYTESSKSAYPSSSHHGAVSDLCRTIRLDLESCELSTPGGLLTVSMRSSTSPRKEDSSGKETSEAALFTPSDAINLNLALCFNQLLDIVLNSHGPGTDEINASPAQLRVCLTKISIIRNMLTQQNSTLTSPQKISDQINVVNLASSVDIDSLWDALTVTSKNENSDSDSHQIRKWDDFSPWRQRVKAQREVLQQWEASQGELLTLRSSLSGMQKELQTRVDELKAAKSANQELSQLMQQSATATTGQDPPSSSSSSSSSASSSLSRSNQGDVSKLKSEIEVRPSRITIGVLCFDVVDVLKCDLMSFDVIRCGVVRCKEEYGLTLMSYPVIQ